MSGILQKSLLPSVYHQGTPSSTRQVYVPGRPSTPARTVYTFNPNAGCIAAPADPVTGDIFTGGGGRIYEVTCNGAYEYVTYPEIPATQGYYTTVNTPGVPGYYTVGGSRIGWDGGAHTIASILKSGIFKFTFAGVSAVVGLVDQDDSRSPSEARHAFYLKRDAYLILERGLTVFTGVAPIAGDVYAIRRVFGEVEYLINDVVVYISAQASTGRVFLDVTMYASGDTVTLVSVEALNPIAVYATAQPMAARLGNVSDFSLYATAQPFLASVTFHRRINLLATAQPAVASLSNKRFFSLLATAAPAESQVVLGRQVIAPPYFTLFAEALPFEAVLANGGNSIRLLATALPMAAYIGQGTFLSIFASMLPATSKLTLGVNGEMTFNEHLPVIDTMSAQSLLSVSFNEQFAVLGSVGFSGLLDAVFNETMTASMGATLQSILTAMFNASVGITGGSGGTAYTNGQRSATAWVTNLDTGAVSMYAGFDFDRMYELDGKYYGVRDTNTYLLDGETDNGAPIDAFVAFGKQTFGTSALKHVPNFYAGVSSTGVLLLRVSTGAQTYTYSPRRTDAISKTQRYDLGKGLRANYYEFELFNQAGCDFELDSVEFLALPSGRRI